MALGPILTAGAGAHALGWAANNSTVERYLRQVHDQVTTDLDLLRSGTALPRIPEPPRPRMVRRASLIVACLQSMLLVGLGAGLIAAAVAVVEVQGRPLTRAGLVVSILLMLVAAFVGGVFAGLPVGFAVYAARNRRHSHFQGATLRFQFWMEREMIRAEVEQRRMTLRDAAARLARWLDGPASPRALA